MNLQKEYWNKIYESILDKKLKYDPWLDKYENILMKSKDTPIIDLGCGFGNDTLYLKERKYEVISCDFSEKALRRLSNFIDNLNVKCFDMKDGLPFQDSSAKVIISDLSLHYFTWNETQDILKEIKRVLINEGTLICRVNSTRDMNYGAGQGIKIEENFYNIDGNLKRFFNESQLRELFREWDILYIMETEINRYNMSKIAWEISIKKM
ncbi:class I SAM-dependent methyltransferase [Clostridium pasteurianum]|uniref:Methylase involved in ubiquinone/menaquinone biosynthesis n=1 Tax=Clostridium pasteurianum BC1 TaxID=86416 RepID=R4JZ20_CLOPA|nr:class I SAM-dependent methyltransferase [Clostridium pasteurianum]AGK95533.1 methylase involved in ubiquinone/menaquinone biosynthesis [Clostridium pasteurianum BC1]